MSQIAELATTARLLARHARRARIPAHLRHPHALRRYCLTRMGDLGVPIHKIAYLAGHVDIRVTQQYLAAGDPEIAAVIDQVDAYTAARGRGQSIPSAERAS